MRFLICTIIFAVSLSICLGQDQLIPTDFGGILRADAASDTLFRPHEVEAQPILDQCPQPEYPDSAMSAGVYGRVVVQALVTEFGAVEKWKIVREQPEGWGFAKAAEKVIPVWRFVPAENKGQPVAVWTLITFRFPSETQGVK